MTRAAILDPQTGSAGQLAVPAVTGISCGGPAHEYAQSDIRDAALEAFPDTSATSKMAGVFENAEIDRRRFSMDLSWYQRPHGLAERNAAYVRTALALAEQHGRAALAQAGWDADELDAIVFVSSTGISTPSLDATLLHRLGARPDVVRLPLFGLGCGGGAAGLGRAGDLVRAGYERVLLVAVELCSLTFLLGDASPANFVGTAIFADGCAALTLGPASASDEDGRSGGSSAELVRLLDAHSETVPDTASLTGWNVDDEGLRLRLGKELPQVMAEHLGPALDASLARRSWHRTDLDALALHPGGAKVIAGYEMVLGLPSEMLDPTRAVLRGHGNMSSPTVLFVLEELIARGLHGRTLVSASGPGFALEHLLVELP